MSAVDLCVDDELTPALPERESLAAMSPPRQDNAGYHEPVMVEEVLDALGVESGGAWVDATVGGGGHAAAVLEASSPDGRLLGIDRDPEAIEEASERLDRFGERVELERGNYGQVESFVEEHFEGPVDGLLVDAGVSSRQLDDPSRGFSHDAEGPLDMRMGPDAIDAGTFLDRVGAERLAEILREYGELKSARRIARCVVDARASGELESTSDLAEVARRADTGTRRGVDPATLVFQAIRIEINGELDHLERLLGQIPSVVARGGRVAVISFHSLEDRLVKRTFRELASDCVCPPDLPVCGCDATREVEILEPGLRRPDDDEIERNPRASSARLRAVEVVRSSAR